MRLSSCAILLLAASWTVNAQKAGAALTFEVASVKLAESPQAVPGRKTASGVGGRGTADSGRFTARYATLSSLIMRTYGLKTYQVIGPSWLPSEHYDIMAKVPDGTTPEQQLAMLQNLLAERFKLIVHRETKEMPVYDLVIAKGGPKFKEFVPPPAPKEGDPPPAGPSKITMDADGFPVLPRTGGMVMVSKNGVVMTAMREQITMATLATRLTGQAGRPITDRTGLQGKYDIALHWSIDAASMGAGAAAGATSPAAPDAGAVPALDIFSALQAQLGLKLEPKKGMVDVLSVDHAEKIPTEN
jgi:uncharacterized protein (TIGR03435 family)